MLRPRRSLLLSLEVNRLFFPLFSGIDDFASVAAPAPVAPAPVPVASTPTAAPVSPTASSPARGESPFHSNRSNQELSTDFACAVTVTVEATDCGPEPTKAVLAPAAAPEGLSRL